LIKNFYETKNYAYFSGVRTELLPFFEGSDKAVLEIGCGTGATLRELKRRGVASEIVGAEIHEGSAQEAKRHLDKVFTGNVEKIALPYEDHFDYIILADVLEHMIDPWQFLQRISPCLKRNGNLIVSIPNVRNWRIFREVFLRGDFDYKEAGVLDRGHLRFFTRKSVEKMLANLGFKAVETKVNIAFDSQRQTKLNKYLFGLLARFFIEQYLVKATKIK
jgi:2-polyprenyl-3-methyl-5-hydroxy-6-metoxy-1,4-benzoquinol methylase